MLGQFGSSRRAQALLLAIVAGEAGVIAYQAAPGSADPAKSSKPPVEQQAPSIGRNALGHAGDFSGVLAAKQQLLAEQNRVGHPGPVGP